MPKEGSMTAGVYLRSDTFTFALQEQEVCVIGET